MSKGFRLQYPCGSGVPLLVGLGIGVARVRESSSTKPRKFERRTVEQVVTAARRIVGAYAELPTQYIDAHGHAYSTNLPASQACSIPVASRCEHALRPRVVEDGASAGRLLLKSTWNVEPVRERAVVEQSA